MIRYDLDYAVARWLLWVGLPPFPDVDDAPPVPPNPGPHIIRHGVDAERSPHHKQVVDRQSHTTTNISSIMIQMQLSYQ